MTTAPNKIAPKIPDLDLGGGLRGGVVKVTPAMAKKWLAENDPDNRNVSHVKVDSLANDIRSGDWKLTHQGVCFNAQWHLIDGQHRLHAIILANTAAELMVTYNPHSKISDPIDRNQPRSLSYLLGKSTKVVSALNVLRMFEIGYALTTPQTTAEAQLMFDHHQEALNELHTRTTCFGKIPGPVLGACAYAYPCNKDRVAEFSQQIATGEMIKRGDPAYSLRQWLASDRSGGVSAWTKALAALNACRYHVHEMKISSIFTGESGFRATTSKRRAMKIDHTPGTNLVVTMAWKPGREEPTTDPVG